MRFDYNDGADRASWMFYVLGGLAILMFLGMFAEVCGALTGETHDAAERNARAYVAAAHPEETVYSLVCARHATKRADGVPCTVSFKSGRRVYLACAGAYTTNEGCWPAPTTRQLEE